MAENRKLHKSFQSRFWGYQLANLVVGSGVFTPVPYDTVVYDPLGEHDVAVANTFVPAQSGYYWIEAKVQFSPCTPATWARIRLTLNGATVEEHYVAQHGWTNEYVKAAYMGWLNAGDAVTASTMHLSGVNENLLGGQYLTYLRGFRYG